MVFLFLNVVALLLCVLIDKKDLSIKRGKASAYNLAKLTFFFLLFLVISFAPATQYGVGTDYFSYVAFYEGLRDPEIFLKKNELLFYISLKTLKWAGLHYQSMFFLTAMVASALILNMFRILQRHGYQLAIVFFIFFTVTNMMHNQMNGLRTFLAVYSFVNAFLYRAEGKNWKSFAFSVFGAGWHMSFLFVAPLFFVPKTFWFFIARNSWVFFLIFFALNSSGLLFKAFDYVLTRYDLLYAHHFEKSRLGVPVINTLADLYYLPLYLIFVHGCSSFSRRMESFDQTLSGFWVFSSMIFLNLIYFDLFVRAHHYVVFFSVIALYWTFWMFRKEPVMLGFMSIYLATPYLLKVLIFAKGEFVYKSFF